VAHSFFSSLRLVHGRACGGLFHSRATDTDETSVLACSRGRENGWWLREHFSLTNSPSRRRVQSVFGQLKSVYTVTVHLTLGGQSSDTSLPNLPGPFWSFALGPLFGTISGWISGWIFRWIFRPILRQAFWCWVTQIFLELHRCCQVFTLCMEANRTCLLCFL